MDNGHTEMNRELRKRIMEKRIETGTTEEIVNKRVDNGILQNHS